MIQKNTVLNSQENVAVLEHNIQVFNYFKHVDDFGSAANELQHTAVVKLWLVNQLKSSFR